MSPGILVFLIASSWFLLELHLNLLSRIMHLEDKFIKVFSTSPHGMAIVKVSDATIKEVNSSF